MGMFDFLRKKQQASQQLIGQEAMAEHVEAQAASQAESNEEQLFKRFMAEESLESGYIRDIVTLANNRRAIEQRIAANSQRAYRALKSFKSAAAVMQRLAQRGTQIAGMANPAAMAGGATVAQANVLASENMELAKDVAIAQKEAEINRQGLRNFVQLENNLAKAFRAAGRLVREYAEQLKEVPTLAEDAKEQLNDLNNVPQFAAAQRRSARQQMQQLRR
ncbi:hypothetical protein HYV85_03240 [Candidatus Woesearchaeota archaeon]|nr:hypothetical protein [Candidatus Woesearchaeota archaeon]